MKTKSPKIAHWLLRFVLKKEERIHRIGDFEEVFQNTAENDGRFSAWKWYWWQVIRSIPKLISNSLFWSFNMLINYLKIAIRQFKKQKSYSIINIAGLSLGMVCTIIIFLWVQDELNYDRFHVNSNELYRVVSEENSGRMWTVTSIPVAPTLKKDYPEIINSTRCNPTFNLITKGDKKFDEKGAFVDPSFFQMFSFPFLEGNQVNVFSNPNSIIVTKKFAEKYFGEESPIGQTVKLENQSQYTITGIIKIPHNSHIRYNYFLPFNLFIQRDRDPSNWGRFQLFTYVQLQKDIQFQLVEDKISNLINQHNPKSNAKLRLQPLNKIHLYGLNDGGPIQYIYIFSIIAIFILIIACINFMNLTTARSSSRAREVGMRKVIGAEKKSLITQFLGEAILFCVIAFFLALIFTYLLLPSFNTLAGKQLSLNLFYNNNMLIGFLGIIIITSILAGSYPAFFLSSYRSIEILHGSLIPIKTGKKKALFRKGLVLIQFSISIFLIFSTIVISKQLNFIQNRNLGYNSEQVLYFQLRGDLNSKYKTIKNEILNNPEVISATAISELPTGIWRSYNGLIWEGQQSDQDVETNMVSVDFDFFKTFGTKMVEGRTFSRSFPSDVSESYILNETAVKAMEIKSPVGKSFEWVDKGNIIGVVKDFHFRSLHEKINPLFMLIDPSRFGYICAKINTDNSNLHKTISHVQSVWEKFAPEFPFEYHFLDEEFEFMYKTERRTSKIINYFSSLAIFISCLGLIGLTSFSSAQRTKEIGIRKVFGASVSRLVSLLSKEFTILIIFSNIVALPLAYFVGNKWLHNFTFRTNVGLEPFIISAFLILTISLLTISSQTVKAARANPIKSLKYE